MTPRPARLLERRPAEPYPAFDGTQACAAVDPSTAEAFLGQPGRDPEPAKQLCKPCKFGTACRDWALSHDVHGVWGGLDDAQRRAARVAAHLPEPTSVGDEFDAMVLAWRRSAARNPDHSLDLTA